MKDKLTIRKSAATALVAASLVLPLTAATASSSAAAPTKTQDGVKLNSIGLPVYTQKATITWWNWSTDGFSQSLVAAFEKVYPNITVKWQDVGASTAEYAKLTTAYAAGSGFPDVVDVEYPYVGQYLAKNDFLNVTKEVAPYKSDFWTANVAEESEQGKIYGVPQNAGWMMLAYDASLFKQDHLTAPKTWAQYASDAAVIKKDNPGKYMGFLPIGDGRYFGALMQEADLVPFYLGKGGQWTINADSPGAIKLIDFWGNLLSQGLLLNSTDFSPSWERQLENGTYASYLLPSYGPGAYSSYFKKGTQLTLTELPQWPGVDSNGNWGGEGENVSAKSKYPEAATIFALFSDLAPTGINVNLRPSSEKGGGQVPSNNNDDKYALFRNTTLPDFGKQHIYELYQKYANLKQAATFEYGPWYAEFTSLLESQLESAASGKQSYAEALKNTQSQLVSYVQEEGYTVKVCKPGATDRTASC